ncbi:MAG: hypothetical protein R2705_16630 [Ilumatobacteraceae bacterium]
MAAPLIVRSGGGSTEADVDPCAEATSTGTETAGAAAAVRLPAASSFLETDHVACVAAQAAAAESASGEETTGDETAADEAAGDETAGEEPTPETAAPLIVRSGGGSATEETSADAPAAEGEAAPAEVAPYDPCAEVLECEDPVPVEVDFEAIAAAEAAAQAAADEAAAAEASPRRRHDRGDQLPRHQRRGHQRRGADRRDRSARHPRSGGSESTDTTVAEEAAADPSAEGEGTEPTTPACVAIVWYNDSDLELAAQLAAQYERGDVIASYALDPEPRHRATSWRSPRP